MKSITQPPRDPRFVQNPYPFYSRARALGDIVYWRDYDVPVAVSHRAVSAVLKHKHTGREPRDGFSPTVPPHLSTLFSLESNSLLELEPPRHTRLRSLVSRVFTTSRLAAFAPQISMLCDQLIDDFPSGVFDLTDAFAQPLPLRVIARILGAPEAMSDRFLKWSHAMLALYQANRDEGVERRAENAARDFSAFLNAWIDERRRQPRDDLISDLIAAEVEGDRLTKEELVSTCVLLLNSGHEANAASLGNGVWALLASRTGPGPLEPTRIAATVEEILRYDPPLHLFHRYVYEDAEIAGHRLSAGTKIGCLLASANRDSEVWVDPERFDPGRTPRVNASFGAGIHLCLGAPLARLELQIALPTLFSRSPGLRSAEAPMFADRYPFRTMERFLVSR